MGIVFEHEIRQRAYAIWVASGMNEGEAEAHWLHAERAVRTEAETAVVSPVKRKAKPGKAQAAETASAKAAANTKAAKVKASTTKSTKTGATAAKATKTSAAPRRPKAGPLEAVA